ncbi:ParB N-terminal domain-containing protein [Amycolatopsis sp. cmx-11-12]|uniref:ParB/RepB/Spo0J family partition protein n=1 Tax=Amycolatopsis sp. cmx-11-12 TaxID=2785795 RepID=UPI003917D235
MEDETAEAAGQARNEGDEWFRLGEVHVVRIADLHPADSPRVDGVDDDHVRALTQFGASLPPIVVHRSTMRVIDGMHRLRVAASSGWTTIEARFFEGTADDAFVVAVQSNARHGLPLSRADRAAATARILVSHPQWSDVTIAERAGVSDKTVAALRKRAEFAVPRAEVRVGRDGRVRPVDPAAGRLRAAEYLSAEPSASIRKVAAAAGITPATAKDVKDRLRRAESPLPPRLRTGLPEEGPPGGDSSETMSSNVTPLPQQVTGVQNDIFAQLSRDPSLRFTDGGRAMLRLLHLHTIDEAGWRTVIDGVPAHCSGAVVEAARACATAWRRIAEELESRESGHSGAAAAR